MLAPARCIFVESLSHQRVAVTLIPRPRIFRATRFRLLERLDSAFFVLRTNRSSKPLETLRESARGVSRAGRIKRAPDLTRRFKVAPQEQGCDRHFRSNRADLDCFATALETGSEGRRRNGQ